MASSPAFSGRMLGILATISLVVSTADAWSEQMSTSLSIGSLRSPSSLAGTWWKAAATRHCGHGRLHAGGHRAAGRDERLELLAQLGQGVGHRDDDLAPQLVLDRDRGLRGAVPRGGDHDDVGVGRLRVVARADREPAGRATARGGCRRPPWPGTSTGTRRRRRTRPTRGGRRVPCPLDLFHRGCRCAQRHRSGGRPAAVQPPRPPPTGNHRLGPSSGSWPACSVPQGSGRRSARRRQQAAATSGYGLAGLPPPGWYSKWRCGVPAALPESPT